MPVTATEVVYDRPWLTDYQEEALFGPERYAVVEATTKSGKTVGCMVWLAEQAMRGEDGHNYWWVAPIHAQAKMVFRRMKRALPQGLYRAREDEPNLTLANGAVIWFMSGDKPDGLYGEDVYAAVIDEASRCKEESWHAVRSTLTATEGPVRIIGNVKGRRNWAYRLARRAESGEADMRYSRITAHDAVAAGIISESEVEGAKRDLPDDVFRELYLAEPADDTGNPFGLDAIRACIRDGLSDMPPVAFGVDLAKSHDWTVLTGLDEHGNVAYFKRWQGPWQDTIGRVVRVVGDQRCVVDSTGVGDPVLEALQRESRGGTFVGYNFTAKSKQRLMEGLAVAIQSGEVGYPDGPIVAELSEFEYEYRRSGVRYTAPEGLHDDCVDSLALSVHCFQKPRREFVVL